jgi:hypothetical protein
MELAVSIGILFALVAIKVGGVWVAFRKYGPRLFPGQPSSAMKAAIVRELFGLVGSGVALGIGTIATNLLSSDDSIVSRYGGWAIGAGIQLALRVLAWFLVIAIFYDRRRAPSGSVARGTIGGVIWSYVLDIPNYALSCTGLWFVFRNTRFC